MDVSSQKVLVSLPPASKSPFHGSPSFPKVSYEFAPCLIHLLPEFPHSFQCVLPRWCSLRADASRTALPWVRSVFEGLSFPKVYHMVGQLLPAYAPRSTEPRSLACAAVIYGNQFPEGFCQSVKSPLDGGPSFPNVSCESTPCVIHLLPELPQSFQCVLSRWCSLRAIASRTASPWVRSVPEGPQVYHMIGQLLPASAPMSTKPRSLARAAVMY